MTQRRDPAVQADCGYEAETYNPAYAAWNVQSSQALYPCCGWRAYWRCGPLLTLRRNGLFVNRSHTDIPLKYTVHHFTAECFYKQARSVLLRIIEENGDASYFLCLSLDPLSARRHQAGHAQQHEAQGGCPNMTSPVLGYLVGWPRAVLCGCQRRQHGNYPERGFEEVGQIGREIGIAYAISCQRFQSLRPALMTSNRAQAGVCRASAAASGAGRELWHHPSLAARIFAHPKTPKKDRGSIASDLS